MSTLKTRPSVTSPPLWAELQPISEASNDDRQSVAFLFLHPVRPPPHHLAASLAPVVINYANVQMSLGGFSCSGGGGPAVASAAGTGAFLAEQDDLARRGAAGICLPASSRRRKENNLLRTNCDIAAETQPFLKRQFPHNNVSHSPSRGRANAVCGQPG